MNLTGTDLDNVEATTTNGVCIQLGESAHTTSFWYRTSDMDANQEARGEPLLESDLFGRELRLQHRAYVYLDNGWRLAPGDRNLERAGDDGISQSDPSLRSPSRSATATTATSRSAAASRSTARTARTSRR
jgi:hypothetical protein